MIGGQIAESSTM